MAAERPTLLDIAKMNGSDALAGLLDEAAIPCPEITGFYMGKSIPYLGSARGIKGTNYKTLVRTSLPTVGFRRANEAPVKGKGKYENRLVETFILNPRWECDKAVADGHEDGAEAFVALEGSAILQASLQHSCGQFYYGVAHDAKGFGGLQANVDGAMLVDAGGTTADTASSVYAVKFGPKHVQWVLGSGGTMQLDDPRIGDILDADGNALTGYIQELLAHIGLQINSTKSVARICNLTADAGKGLTDDLLSDLVDLMDETPDVLLMTKRSRGQLKKSRTATNATGAPAPTPTDYEGIPIVATLSLSNTEALVA